MSAGSGRDQEELKDIVEVEVRSIIEPEEFEGVQELEWINEFARLARQGLRKEDGTFRRSHIRRLVQRAEVGADQIMIKGSALKLLQTLAEASGVETGR